MKEEGHINKFASDFLIFAQGISYDLSKFRDDFTPFFNFERPYLSPRQKVKNLRPGLVAMTMINKRAKFHKDSTSGKKVKFNLPSVIELSKTADFLYNFV